MFLELDFATEYSDDFIIEHLDYDYINACSDSYSPLGEYGPVQE